MACSHSCRGEQECPGCTDVVRDSVPVVLNSYAKEMVQRTKIFHGEFLFECSDDPV